jgi:hypothetical protein
MKKYFGNKQKWTLEELKNVVSANEQLGFYWESIICPITGVITIHNWNNGNKGRISIKFVKESENTWTRVI